MSSHNTSRHHTRDAPFLSLLCFVGPRCPSFSLHNKSIDNLSLTISGTTFIPRSDFKPKLFHITQHTVRVKDHPPNANSIEYEQLDLHCNFRDCRVPALVQWTEHRLPCLPSLPASTTESHCLNRRRPSCYASALCSPSRLFWCFSWLLYAPIINSVPPPSSNEPAVIQRVLRGDSEVSKYERDVRQGSDPHSHLVVALIVSQLVLLVLQLSLVSLLLLRPLPLFGSVHGAA